MRLLSCVDSTHARRAVGSRNPSISYGQPPKSRGHVPFVAPVKDRHPGRAGAAPEQNRALAGLGRDLGHQGLWELSLAIQMTDLLGAQPPTGVPIGLGQRDVHGRGHA